MYILIKRGRDSDVEQYNTILGLEEPAWPIMMASQLSANFEALFYLSLDRWKEIQKFPL